MQKKDLKKKKPKKTSSCSHHPPVIEPLHPPSQRPPALSCATVPASLDGLNVRMRFFFCALRWPFYLILPNADELLWNICWLHLKCQYSSRGGKKEALQRKGDKEAATAACCPGSYSFRGNNDGFSSLGISIPIAVTSDFFQMFQMKHVVMASDNSSTLPFRRVVYFLFFFFFFSLNLAKSQPSSHLYSVAGFD